MGEGAVLQRNFEHSWKPSIVFYSTSGADLPCVCVTCAIEQISHLLDLHDLWHKVLERHVLEIKVFRTCKRTASAHIPYWLAVSDDTCRHESWTLALNCARKTKSFLVHITFIGQNCQVCVLEPLSPIVPAVSRIPSCDAANMHWWLIFIFILFNTCT